MRSGTPPYDRQVVDLDDPDTRGKGGRLRLATRASNRKSRENRKSVARRSMTSSARICRTRRRTVSDRKIIAIRPNFITADAPKWDFIPHAPLRLNKMIYNCDLDKRIDAALLAKQSGIPTRCWYERRAAWGMRKQIRCHDILFRARCCLTAMRGSPRPKMMSDNVRHNRLSHAPTRRTGHRIGVGAPFRVPSE